MLVGSLAAAHWRARYGECDAEVIYPLHPGDLFLAPPLWPLTLTHLYQQLIAHGLTTQNNPGAGSGFCSAGPRFVFSTGWQNVWCTVLENQTTIQRHERH